MPVSPCVEAKFMRRLHGELIMFVYIMQTRGAADMEKYVQKQSSPKNLVIPFGRNFIPLCYKYKTQEKNRNN